MPRTASPKGLWNAHLFVCQPSPRSGDLNELSLSTTVSHFMNAGEFAGMVCMVDGEMIERVDCSTN